MFKRRRIGVAYELYPAERVGMWAQRNILSLVGGSAGLVVWCLLVIFAAKMLNWLNEGSGGDGQVVFDDNGATGVAIKLIGGIVIFIVIVTRQSK